ncbi:MAG: ThiF family adenylyltransferase, partial [Burkholderiaceae bacterium]|nr:ThiF family adenylyltransferase [Burkholderiaceae bacterium]
RQIMHNSARVGTPKVQSGKQAMQDINPEIEIIALQERLQGDRLNACVQAADIVLDCSDNFATRHAINRACVRQGKPLVSGAAVRFDGQISVFDTRTPGAPCYACLFPPEQPYEEVQCATMGIFAPLVGIIGAMQAAEALKILAQVGESLAGRLLLLDARSMDWTSIKIARDPACSVCGSVHATPAPRK